MYTAEWEDSQKFLFDYSKLRRSQRRRKTFFDEVDPRKDHCEQLIGYQAISTFNIFEEDRRLPYAGSWKEAVAMLEASLTPCVWPLADKDVIYCPPAPVKPRDVSRGQADEATKARWANKQRALENRFNEASEAAKRARIGGMEKEFMSNDAQDPFLADMIETERGGLLVPYDDSPDLMCYEDISPPPPYDEGEPQMWLERGDGSLLRANVYMEEIRSSIACVEATLNRLNTDIQAVEANIENHRARMVKIPTKYWTQGGHDKRCEKLYAMQEELVTLQAERGEATAGLLSLQTAKETAARMS